MAKRRAASYVTEAISNPDLAGRFSANVSDRQIEGVKEVALAKSSRLQDAMKRYNDAMSAQIKKGVPADKASRFASKELDEVAELVKRHAVEAKDSDPTVLLDIAAALTSSAIGLSAAPATKPSRTGTTRLPERSLA